MGEESSINDTVSEWEAGLPSADDLTPLSQSLIPPDLASAFKISPEPKRSSNDVTRASHSTLSSLRSPGPTPFKPYDQNDDDQDDDGSDPKRTRAEDPEDQSTSATTTTTTTTTKTVKRPRLVWTPQLHKRFVDVVAHLGLKNAVPKTIMQLMNVEGLTRENVASHLQKYRLYVKRMQGLSNEGPSTSDHLFASTPVPPQSLNEAVGSGQSQSNGMVPYPQMVQMMGQSHHHQQHHQRNHYQYGLVQQQQQQRDWSNGNGFNGFQQHMTQNKS